MFVNEDHKGSHQRLIKRELQGAIRGTIQRANQEALQSLLPGPLRGEPLIDFNRKTFRDTLRSNSTPQEHFEEYFSKSLK